MAAKGAPGTESTTEHENEGPETSSRNETHSLDVKIGNSFARFATETWFHGRSRRDTFKLLIDTFRMRVEDQYVFTGDVSMDTVYGGAPDNIRAFGKFLTRVQRKSGLLPEWWTAETLMECIIFGL